MRCVKVDRCLNVVDDVSHLDGHMYWFDNLKFKTQREPEGSHYFTASTHGSPSRCRGRRLSSGQPHPTQLRAVTRCVGPLGPESVSSVQRAPQRLAANGWAGCPYPPHHESRAPEF